MLLGGRERRKEEVRGWESVRVVGREGPRTLVIMIFIYKLRRCGGAAAGDSAGAMRATLGIMCGLCGAKAKQGKGEGRWTAGASR